MNIFGLEINFKNLPVLDPDFIPMLQFQEAYKVGATEKISLAVERADGMAVYNTLIHATPESKELDRFYIERIVKNILWFKGGYKIYVCGSDDIYEYLHQTYSAEGDRNFDYDFMSTVYEMPFSVVKCTPETFPAEQENAQAVGGHLDGCRIGFDAGGSDRKVCAVVDGECVYSEEVVWFPKITEDWNYHYKEILTAMKTAASHMPRVDAIGVSSAGVFVENETKVASLFLKIPKDDFQAHIKTIFLDAAKEVADVPCIVCNDGDVSALAGGMSLGENNVLGIAMGTSEAVGFLNADGCITGWLNELAFAPVDANPNAEQDEWSHDYGVGCKYFSQDAVIKLARNTSIELPDTCSPGEKLKIVQKAMIEGNEDAVKIFDSIGVYLGHSLPYYYTMYGYHNALLMGRVLSGLGGDLILKRALEVINQEYPEISKEIAPQLPSEQARRVGQSVAAATLPRSLS